MTDAYTYIPKPTDATYINVNTVGKQQYDESTILYDDPGIFYDSVDNSAYTNIPKPTQAGIVVKAGTATGLLIPPTYATSRTIGSKDSYTYVSKPTI